MSFDNNHDDKKKSKRSLYHILDKEGFYIILFLCVCIVAVTAVWVSNQNEDPLVVEDTPNRLEEDQPEVTLVEGNIEEPEDKSSETVAKPAKEETESTKSQTTEGDKEAIPKDEENMDAEDNSSEETDATVASANLIMSMPVVGTLGLPFAQDHLVYHETLEQWSTHKGVDIHAEEGAPVRAALDGEVIEVLNDTIMGITISVLHDEDTITRYSNLSTDAMVKVGTLVSKGQIISGVGRTASVKTLEGPLLHFQVIRDGKPVDPQAYLLEFNN